MSEGRTNSERRESGVIQRKRSKIIFTRLSKFKLDFQRIGQLKKNKPNQKEERFMQIQLFTIPAIESKGALEEMNRFLRGHRVLKVRQEFSKDIGGAFWYFSIKYIDGMFSSPNTSKNVKKKKITKNYWIKKIL